MSLKNAAFLALVGMILVTILLVVGFINDVLGVAQGIVPAVKLLTSLIYAFAALTVTVFFYAFHRAQAR
jgi:hypothetical protein